MREYDILKWMEENGESHNIALNLENPKRNFLWDLLSLDGKYDGLSISTLNIGGWYDLFRDGTCEAYRGFKKISKNKNNQMLIMGPWTHSGYLKNTQGELIYPSNSILNIEEIIENWFDFYLKEKGKKPFEDITFLGYLMGDTTSPSNDYNLWVSLEEFNQINYPLKRFYFSKENKLVLKKPEDTSFIETIFDPENPSPTIRETFEEEKLLEEGKTYKIKVDIGNTFYFFKENHSIGVILSGSNYPRFEINPQSGEEIHKETKKEKARVKIYFSKNHPSRIVFPTFEEKGHKISF